MQRTQIYMETDTLDDLRQIARQMNISVSEFIRRTVRREIHRHKKDSLIDYIDRMEPLESFADVDPEAYVRDLRSRSRLLHE